MTAEAEGTGEEMAVGVRLHVGGTADATGGGGREGLAPCWGRGAETGCRCG